MNENINLCEILKGLEGIKLYTSVFGYITLDRIDLSSDYPIIVKDKKGFGNSITKNGLLSDSYNGECIIFPDKNQRDWSKFERPINVNTPMMCSDTYDKDTNEYAFSLKYYAGYSNNKHYCYANGFKSKNNTTSHAYTYMIPYSLFNPNNIEESLKNNIQK